MPHPNPAQRQNAKTPILVAIAVCVIAAVVGHSRAPRHQHDPSDVRPPLRPSQGEKPAFVPSDIQAGSVLYTVDGRFLITTGIGDGNSTYRNPNTGAVVRQWPGGGESWASDDGRLILQRKDGNISRYSATLHDTQRGVVLRRWDGQVVAVSINRTRVLTVANADRPLAEDRRPRTATISDFATGRLIGRLTLPGCITSAAISDDDKWLCIAALGTPAKLLRIADMNQALPSGGAASGGVLPSGSMKSAIPMPELINLNVSRDGTWAYGISRDGVSYTWQIGGGRHTAIQTGMAPGAWQSETADGRLIVQGVQQFLPRFQIRADRSNVLKASIQGTVKAMSRDGRMLVYTSPGGGVEGDYFVYDTQHCATVAQLDVSPDRLRPSTDPFNHRELFFTVMDGGVHVACAERSGLIRLFNLSKQVGKSG